MKVGCIATARSLFILRAHVNGVVQLTVAQLPRIVRSAFVRRYERVAAGLWVHQRLIVVEHRTVQRLPYDRAVCHEVELAIDLRQAADVGDGQMGGDLKYDLGRERQ